MNSPKLKRLKSMHVVTMLHSTYYFISPIQFKIFLQSHAAFSIFLFPLFFFFVSISLKVRILLYYWQKVKQTIWLSLHEPFTSQRLCGWMINRFNGTQWGQSFPLDFLNLNIQRHQYNFLVTCLLAMTAKVMGFYSFPSF